MDQKLREQAVVDMTKATSFYDRAKADAYEQESRAKGLFVRRSEAVVKVSNRVAPGAAKHRPRYRIIIVERCG
jgi:hypothetical protein